MTANFLAFACSSVKKKRASGSRKPTNKPRGRVPGGQHIEPHDLFQYAMYKSLVVSENALNNVSVAPSTLRGLIQHLLFVRCNAW